MAADLSINNAAIQQEARNLLRDLISRREGNRVITNRINALQSNGDFRTNHASPAFVAWAERFVRNANNEDLELAEMAVFLERAVAEFAATDSSLAGRARLA